jgi:hypothetical protein
MDSRRSRGKRLRTTGTGHRSKPVPGDWKFLESGLDGFPVVRQKLRNPCDGMGSDAGKDVFKPGGGFDTNPLAEPQPF